MVQKEVVAVEAVTRGPVAFGAERATTFFQRTWRAELLAMVVEMTVEATGVVAMAVVSAEAAREAEGATAFANHTRIHPKKIATSSWDLFLSGRNLLAWLPRKHPTLGHHFPAIHGDSAQTKGTLLPGIVSSS